jgi:hypothetical protein
MTKNNMATVSTTGHLTTVVTTATSGNIITSSSGIGINNTMSYSGAPVSIGGTISTNQKTPRLMMNQDGSITMTDLDNFSVTLTQQHVTDLIALLGVINDSADSNDLFGEIREAITVKKAFMKLEK